MSFREKSAWVMGAVMLLTGALYFVLAAPDPHGPLGAVLIPYAAAVIVLSIVVQVGLAISSPREAKAPADERERLAIDRAGSISGRTLAGLVVIAGGIFLVLPSGEMLFHHLVVALIVSQLVDYALQITYLRRSF